MGATVNIDTGGTFTDGYFTRGDVAVRVKVDTTPHDLTECLARCVAEGASRLGYPGVQALLVDTDVFRFSSTIGTNSIIQRSGPRIGLLVSPGAGGSLYGDGPSPLFEYLVRGDLVAEVADPFDAEEVRAAVRRLLVGGARILVASLEGSEDDSTGEEAIKKLVATEYPRHYLGAVPCLLASEVTPRAGAERRTATALVNAYLHPDMVRSLYKADEDLRRDGYPHPLLIVHASGGVARVAKTRAIETYNSGPVGGVHGTARMARHYELPYAAAIDVGGTSTDVSVVVDGQVAFETDPHVENVPVHSPMVWVEAIGGGGGSIARRTDSGYTVGPDSAGAAPGPACYGLGGTQAAVTDAELLLGHLDPEWFLGGRRRLDPERSRSALERIAGDDSPEDAAWQVHRALVRVVVDKVTEELAVRSIDPSEVTLFAFGGGGGLIAAEVAAECGVPRVLSFSQSSVFSAFGISGMDVSHVYELRPGDEVEQGAVRQRAELDVAGEGLDDRDISYAWEVEETDGEVRVVEVDGDWSAAAAQVPATARGVRLRATVPMPHAAVPSHGVKASDPSAARKGERQVHRPDGGVTAAVFDRDRLEPGNVVEGPALVEAVDTTIVVPTGSRMTIDEHGTGIIEVGS